MEVTIDKLECDILIGGDFNASLHRDPPNVFDKLLREFCHVYQLILCQYYPATATFYHSNNEHSSTIDYLLMRSTSRRSLSKICVHVGEDDLSTNNTSDHVPVSEQISVTLSQPKSGKPIKCRGDVIRWDRRLQQEYEDEVRNQLAEIHMDLSSSVNIDWTLHQFHSCLKAAAKKCMPVTKRGH